MCACGGVECEHIGFVIISYEHLTNEFASYHTCEISSLCLAEIIRTIKANNARTLIRIRLFLNRCGLIGGITKREEHMRSMICRYDHISRTLLFIDWEIAIACSRQMIRSGLQVEECEYAVVIVINRVSADGIACLIGKINSSTIERNPLVIGFRRIIKERIRHLLIHIFYGTQDIPCSIGICLEIIHDAAEVRKTFHVAVIGVESTMASRLIGMEIAFPKTTNNTMLQHT